MLNCKKLVKIVKIFFIFYSRFQNQLENEIKLCNYLYFDQTKHNFRGACEATNEKIPLRTKKKT